MTEEDARSSAAARALDALEPHEAAAVDAAARRSTNLRGEVDAFAGTAAQLGLAARPVAPSSGLKARLLADIARTPQYPAVDDTSTGAIAVPGGAHAAVDPGAGAVADTAAAPGRPSAAPAAAHRGPGMPAGTTTPTPAESRARVRWYARPGLVLGAAAAAAAIFAGGVVLGDTLNGDDRTMQAQADALAELFAAPDAQRSSADVEGDATATLVWSEQLDRSVVVFDDLGTLPDDSVYEAWYIDSAGAATPAGTFRSDGDGHVFHLLDGSLRGGTVGVTVEPESGSDAPTTKPIVLLNRA